MKYFLVFLLMTFSVQVFSEESQESKTLISEYNKIVKIIKKSKSDGTIDGFTEYKIVGDGIDLIWTFGETQENPTMIRIYKKKDKNEKSFSVSYYRNSSIIKGTTVIRRFIGSNATGWRNDTVDLSDNQYMGSQGSLSLRLSPKDEGILEVWGITQFGDNMSGETD